uniref:Uncharacterized protein n=1 Tax=Knipowitschia caucasica TaxID=637954 RepID=A0AAV2KU65_KNICA
MGCVRASPPQLATSLVRPRPPKNPLEAQGHCPGLFIFLIYGVYNTEVRSTVNRIKERRKALNFSNGASSRPSSSTTSRPTSLPLSPSQEETHTGSSCSSGPGPARPEEPAALGSRSYKVGSFLGEWGPGVRAWWLGAWCGSLVWGPGGWGLGVGALCVRAWWVWAWCRGLLGGGPGGWGPGVGAWCGGLVWGPGVYGGLV